jgi:serine/threonine protein phosphatase PrpC
MDAANTGSAFVSEQGPFRRRNEDTALLRADQGIYIVADGLGGAAAGDLASRVATELIEAMLSSTASALKMVDNLMPEGEFRDVLKRAVANDQDLMDDRLRLAMLLAHYGVLAEARHTGSIGMATAIVVCWHRDGLCRIAHIGDCRAYALEASTLHLLTRDHSLSVALAGRMTLPKGAENSPFLRSRLTQVVGGEICPTPDLCEWSPAKGSQLLLCSDGVWGDLSEEDITQIMGDRTRHPETVCQKLVEAAIAAGSRDNATAMIVRF